MGGKIRKKGKELNADKQKGDELVSEGRVGKGKELARVGGVERKE